MDPLNACLRFIGGIVFLAVIFNPEKSTEITLGENSAVTRFREYLRINSSHPNPDYESCINWLKSQAVDIGLEFHKVDFPAPDLFVVWLTWEGSNPFLKSIMLNSHLDVVPADASKWTYDPFSATKDKHGDIYARGAQDDKAVGAAYLEAIRRLRNQGFVPMRTVHVTFMPHEETGGHHGMIPFVNSKYFQELNVGMEMDEGLHSALSKDEYFIYYSEKTLWQFKVIATGKSGHAAVMFDDNAAVKLERVISKLLAFRQEQKDVLTNDTELSIGDVTSINLNRLGGGVAANVVPSELWAVFDMRIKEGKNWQLSDVEKFLENIIISAGPGVRIKYLNKGITSSITNLDPENEWWTTIKSTFDEMGWKLSSHYLPGITDARFLRQKGYPAFGLSPFIKTDNLEHEDNEYINEKSFLHGITVYEAILQRLANMSSLNIT